MPTDPLTELLASGAILQPDAPLATPAQKLLEERAMDLYSRPEIFDARAGIEALFRADRNAKLADQETAIARSAAEHAFHACLVAAGESPDLPRFVWTINPAHRWLGMEVPGSRIGQDNPDNIYRFASVDPDQGYKISGCFVAQPPTDFSICSLPAQVGEGIAADVCGMITRDSLDVDGHGRFEILVDGTATDGRRDHLSIAGARVLMVRDTLGDWQAERPCWLHIDPLSNPGTNGNDGFDPARAASRAAQLAVQTPRFLLNMVQHGMCETGPVNSIPAPVPSAGRGGLATQSATVGYYRLGDGEAWIITLDDLRARYLGVQVCDMWLLSHDYTRNTSCLNQRQAVPDDDDRYRLVVSATDPGVHNWLDDGGAGLGTILVRWQGIPAGADLAGAVSTRVVPLDALREELPASTKYLSPEAREKQRRERWRNYNHRLGAS